MLPSELRKIKSIERIIKEFNNKDIPDGRQFEVQLMSLANKVNHTEINHEIDPLITPTACLRRLLRRTHKKFFSVNLTVFIIIKESHILMQAIRAVIKKLVRVHKIFHQLEARWLLG